MHQPQIQGHNKTCTTISLWQLQAEVTIHVIILYYADEMWQPITSMLS